LVASLTADRHIAKGVYRPHVSEQPQALNLAVFEMVDYVVIDPTRPTTNKNAILAWEVVFAADPDLRGHRSAQWLWFEPFHAACPHE